MTANDLIDAAKRNQRIETDLGLSHELQLRGHTSVGPSNISRWRAMPPDKGPSWRITWELLEMAGWLRPKAVDVLHAARNGRAR